MRCRLNCKDAIQEMLGMQGRPLLLERLPTCALEGGPQEGLPRFNDKGGVFIVDEGGFVPRKWWERSPRDMVGRLAVE